MKKLLLFLSLSATNIVHGVIEVGAIQEILVKINDSAADYDKGKIDKNETLAKFAKELIEAAVAAAQNTIGPKPQVDKKLADCCHDIIKHVVTHGECQYFIFKMYKDLFKKLYDDWAVSFSKMYQKSGPLQGYARTFCVSLIVNYRIFVRDYTGAQDKLLIDIKSIINNFYKGNFVFSDFAFKTISKTADQLFDDSELMQNKEHLVYWNRAIGNNDKNVLVGFILEAYRCLANKENAQELPQPQEDAPTFLENFPLQRVMTIGGGSALVILCASTEKGRKKSGETLELAKEHPKKTAGIIATLLAGVAYKLMV